MKQVTPKSAIGKIALFVKEHRYAFLITLVVMLFIYAVSFLPAYVDKVTPHTETVKILVAAQDIEPQTEITPDDVTVVDFVKGSTPLNSIGAEYRKNVTGKTSSVSIKKGDIFTPTLIGDSSRSGKQGLAQYIQEGRKAFYLKSADVQTPPSGLENHDHVDIIGFDTQGKSTKNTIGILKNAEVIDILNSGKGDTSSTIVLSLTDTELVTINDALANKWFLEVVLLHRDKKKVSNKLTR